MSAWRAKAAAAAFAALSLAFAPAAFARAEEPGFLGRIAALEERADAARANENGGGDDAREKEGAETESVPEGLVFFGDSRVVGMGAYAPAEGTSFVGESGAGYDWMVGAGAAALEAELAARPEAGVVFCFGVNDLWNAQEYAAWFESWTAARPERVAWFSSVWPIDDAAAAAIGYSVTNAKADAFDDALEAALGERFLDVDDEIEKRGFYATDGLHYDEATYASIREVVSQAAKAAAKGGS